MLRSFHKGWTRVPLADNQVFLTQSASMEGEDKNLRRWRTLHFKQEAAAYAKAAA